jgi:putative tryptophan/tyrosine transport system substrate-binding protein
MRLIGLAVILALSLILAPFAADTQQAGKIYRIGILATYPVGPFFRDPFMARLRELDYVEGQNLVLEIRSANNIPERLPALAVELVRLNVDVIVTGGDSEVRAARQATRTIPIVMAPSGDPVRAGYVASLARPGGNITGVSWMSPERSAKLLEVLKDAGPQDVTHRSPLEFRQSRESDRFRGDTASSAGTPVDRVLDRGEGSKGF